MIFYDVISKIYRDILNKYGSRSYQLICTPSDLSMDLKNKKVREKLANIIERELKPFIGIKIKRIQVNTICFEIILERDYCVSVFETQDLGGVVNKEVVYAKENYVEIDDAVNEGVIIVDADSKLRLNFSKDFTNRGVIIMSNFDLCRCSVIKNYGYIYGFNDNLDHYNSDVHHTSVINYKLITTAYTCNIRINNIDCLLVGGRVLNIGANTGYISIEDKCMATFTGRYVKGKIINNGTINQIDVMDSLSDSVDYDLCLSGKVINNKFMLLANTQINGLLSNGPKAGIKVKQSISEGPNGLVVTGKLRNFGDIVYKMNYSEGCDYIEIIGCDKVSCIHNYGEIENYKNIKITVNNKSILKNFSTGKLEKDEMLTIEYESYNTHVKEQKNKIEENKDTITETTDQKLTVCSNTDDDFEDPEYFYDRQSSYEPRDYYSLINYLSVCDYSNGFNKCALCTKNEDKILTNSGISIGIGCDSCMGILPHEIYQDEESDYSYVFSNQTS